MYNSDLKPVYEKDIWNQVYAFLKHGVLPNTKVTVNQVKNFKARCRNNYILTEEGLYFKKKHNDCK